MGAGGPILSPWQYACSDYVGLSMGVQISFNNATRAITSCYMYRDPGCQYTTFVVGFGSTEKRIAGPSDTDKDGVTTYTAQQMARVGLNTIEDVLALQITVEP